MALILSVIKGCLSAPLLILVVVVVVGCAGTRPLIEQSRAHVARHHAKENGATKHSPKNYRMGLSLLKKADQLFKDRRYGEAQKHYAYAMKYFEKSEVRARLLNVKEGGAL